MSAADAMIPWLRVAATVAWVIVTDALRPWLCRHKGPLEWERNIYGDEINHSGGKRSLWRCRCGKLVAKGYLVREAD